MDQSKRFLIDADKSDSSIADSTCPRVNVIIKDCKITLVCNDDDDDEPARIVGAASPCSMVTIHIAKDHFLVPEFDRKQILDALLG